MTPEWREFAATVDRVCAASYNYALAQDARVREIADAKRWSMPRAEAAIVEIWSQQVGRIDAAASKLGTPPEKAGLFDRWHANVDTRAALFHQASVVARSGDFG